MFGRLIPRVLGRVVFASAVVSAGSSCKRTFLDAVPPTIQNDAKKTTVRVAATQMVYLFIFISTFISIIERN